MFEKIKEKFQDELVMPDKEKLLQEIRRENCRQILITQINLRLLEREKIQKDANLPQIEQLIRSNKKGLQQLTVGTKLIDEELGQLKKE